MYIFDIVIMIRYLLSKCKSEELFKKFSHLIKKSII